MADEEELTGPNLAAYSYERTELAICSHTERGLKSEISTYLQGHSPIWFCEICDVLAKAVGTGREHQCHNNNRKDLSLRLSVCIMQPNVAHEELTVDAKIVQSSQPSPDLELNRDHSRIATKAGVMIKKTIHGT